MKVALNGAVHFGSQIPRIADGFRALGHEVTPHWHEADLIYSQNDHAQVIADKWAGRLKPGAKVILCCLDVPSHLFSQGYDVAPLTEQLKAADAVVTISQFGQWQVKTYCGLDSTVVWNPIKPVRRDPAVRQRPFPRFLSAARRSDFNKRFGLAAAALQILGYTERDVALVGNEGGWGDYLGVLSDENLNVAYNSADFVICTGLVEGLNLGVIEGMATGCVPLIIRDLTTRTELLPPELFPEYATVDPRPDSLARFIAHYVNDEGGMRLANLRGRLHDHYVKNLAERTSPAGVAGRILAAYQNTLT